MDQNTVLLKMSLPELRATLKQLISDKKSGKLDAPKHFNNQLTMWRGVLDYHVLQDCIKHYSPEVRRDVIELLAVSKRSTQNFIEFELDLIQTFLIYNLGERIDFVPLIKTILRRARDSLIVLRRLFAEAKKNEDSEDSNEDSLSESKESNADVFEMTASGLNSLIRYYEAFLPRLRDICVNSLFPTANYERRHSSLQILYLMNEILTPEVINFAWNQDQTRLLFNCLLLDTYDTNKDMIYSILKMVPPELLGLNDKKFVAEIVDTAVILGNSIRPIDTTTASFLFKLLLQSPVVEEIISLLCNVDFGEHDDVHLILVIFLISRLKQPLKLARENIVRAAGKHSLYGYIYCIKCLLTDRCLRAVPIHSLWRPVIVNLVEMCFDLNAVVGQIVNNSSPEGHLPMDLNPCNSLLFESEPESDKVTTPQMVLLCAWRTVKEVSLLLSHLTRKATVDRLEGEVGLLTEKQITDIGEHFVTLLSETKHRGAFEQAHVAFGQLCYCLWNLPDGRSLKELPKIWLLQLLLAVTGVSSKDSKLCATRRSAGVPFMVQALLTSEVSLTAVIKNGGSPTFHSTMKILLALSNLTANDVTDSRLKDLIYKDTAFCELQDHASIINAQENIASSGIEKNASHRLNEIKTHVLNIIRALYRHSQLGECVKPYVADGVITAIKCYNGKTWAVRNAATLLFSAMITRIFGVQRTKDHVNLSVHNKMTGNVFFKRYPSLLDFMYAELEVFVKPGDTLIKPGVQSVLLLLSRLYSGCHENEDSNCKVTEFVNMVSKCAKSQVYETRELAARALVSLLTETTAQQMFHYLLKAVLTESRTSSNINLIHGYMLQLLQITKTSGLTTFESSSAEFHRFSRESNWILENLENNTRKCASFSLAATYVQLLVEIYKLNPQWFSNHVQDEEFKVFNTIRRHLVGSHMLRNGPAREVYEVAATKFLTSWCDNETLLHTPLDSLPRDRDIFASWTPLLSHDNIDVQTVTWIKLKELIDLRITSAFGRMQLTEAIAKSDQRMRDSINDPELEGALFEFLYVVFTSTENANALACDAQQLLSLAEATMIHLTKKLHDQYYYVTDSFIRVIGAVYGKILNNSKEIASLKDWRKLYELLFNNSWMDSCNNDCRLAVSQIILNLYQSPMIDNDYFVLTWWTTLLNLLVDDDKKVRQLASLVVTEVDTRTELTCDKLVRDCFFRKFTEIVGKKRPDIAWAALITWGVASWRDDDYEMDDTDVFNKCKNYECYEQLTISNLSLSSFKEITNKYSMAGKLPPDTIEWLKKMYDCEVPFVTLPEFMKVLGDSIPTLSNKLDEYVDPTYCDKLQQALAFKQFQNSLINEENAEIRA